MSVELDQLNEGVDLPASFIVYDSKYFGDENLWNYSNSLI